MGAKDYDAEKRLAEFETPARRLRDIGLNLRVSPLVCGFREIERLGYLRERCGDLVVCAARPSHGKTALAMQIARNVAMTERNVLVFSMEMSAEELNTRLCAQEAEMSINKLHENPSAVAAAKERLGLLPVLIDDEPGIGINEIVSRTLATHKASPLSLIVVDYLQIVGTSMGRSKHEEVLEVAQKLKQLAREIEVPVLALAQMTRDIDNRVKYDKEARPQLSDVADSSGIEKTADIMFFLQRPYLINRTFPGEAKVFGAKNRHGDVKDFTLGFSGELVKFFSRTEDSL